MILVDANLLIYAFVQDLPQHAAAYAWLDRQLRDGAQVALPWASLLAFVRLVTNQRIFRRPVPLRDAWEQVERWLAVPSVWIPGATERHAEILGRFLRTLDLDSNSVPDAHLAALAIEHDLTLVSSDRGFDRFPDLRWQNPLSAE